jgi:hypothetical protein
MVPRQAAVRITLARPFDKDIKIADLESQVALLTASHLAMLSVEFSILWPTFQESMARFNA